MDTLSVVSFRRLLRASIWIPSTRQTVRLPHASPRCPWRIGASSRDRKLKQAAAMLFPSVLAHVCDLIVCRFDRSRTIPASMTSALVVIAVIFRKLVLQVSRSRKESLIMMDSARNKSTLRRLSFACPRLVSQGGPRMLVSGS